MHEVTGIRIETIVVVMGGVRWRFVHDERIKITYEIKPLSADILPPSRPMTTMSGVLESP